MKSIGFPEVNVDVGDDGFAGNFNAAGELVTRWRLGFWERLRVLFLGDMWLVSCTMGQEIQPQILSVGKPEMGEREDEAATG